MNLIEKQKLIRQLKDQYRHIMLEYFINEPENLSKIDKFINALFCANIPVPKIIEMHMELIDDFSNQLKIEGREDEALLDYRLVLIDILAHLCELYRSSMSR